VFFCLSAGFVFRDVARGSEPMIRFLTMVKALTSLIVGMSCISGMPCILHFHDQILSNVHVSADISK
jgi:hypothetical protein